MTAVFFVVGWGYGRELVQGANVGVRPLAPRKGWVNDLPLAAGHNYAILPSTDLRVY